MPKVRDVGFLSEKWVRNASNAAPNYRQGVEQPLESWQQNTLKAKSAWEQGIQQAITRGSWEAGIREAGDEKWRRGAVEKGAQRYAQGVAAAKEEWARKWEPYRAVLESVTLPDRGPKGSEQNWERSRRVGMALHEAKLRRTGTGR